MGAPAYLRPGDLDELHTASMLRPEPYEVTCDASGIHVLVELPPNGVAAVTLNISMSLRGAETLAIRDVVAGFIVVGVLCMASTFSFRRLDPLAGAHLNGAKQSDDE